MTYVDGFVLPVPAKNKTKYKKMAVEGSKAWMKHGALQYFECWGDDLHPEMPGAKIAHFDKLAKAKKGESVVFAFIVYKDKAHRDKVNKAVMKEMEEHAMKDMEMPFDMKRMAYGGFETIVEG